MVLRFLWMLKPYSATYTPSGSEMESVRLNIVRHLATLMPDGEKAVVLFLVRNATDGVSDYRLSFRDSIMNLSPVVNKTFTIHPDPGKNQVTILQVMNNQFLRGEKLRVLAFEIPLSKEAIFYTMKMAEGSLVFFPNYMYVPPKGVSKPSGDVLEPRLPDAIVERADGFHIAPGTTLTLERDLVIPTAGLFI